MWNLTSFHLETVLVSVQDRCMVMWVIWNLAFFRLETVLVSVQDSCMVCAKHTTGLEIVLEATDGTPR